MKYIRTKEGKIIDIDKRYQWHLENGWINKRIKDKETFIKISHHNIVAQADTIEELCDGYIVELPMRRYHFYFEKERNDFAFKTAVDEYNKWRGTRSDMSIEGKGSKELVYLWGVIWVKGAYGQLIPKVVAKMNEKGCLEVL